MEGWGDALFTVCVLWPSPPLCLCGLSWCQPRALLGGWCTWDAVCGGLASSAFPAAAEKGGPVLLLGPHFELPEKEGMCLPGSSPVLGLAGGDRPPTQAVWPCVTNLCPYTPSVSPAWRQH